MDSITQSHFSDEAFHNEANNTSLAITSDEDWVQCSAEQLRLHDEVKVVTPHWTIRGLVDQGGGFRRIGISDSRFVDRMANPETGQRLHLNELNEGATIFRKAGMLPVPDADRERVILVSSYVSYRGDIVTLNTPRLMLWHTGAGEYFADGLRIPPHDVIAWSPVMVTAQPIDHKHYGQRK